ncbi:MAG: excinuclease ABC subunit C, partial [Candidatus Adiutrix sp.]|nr:excinuclease ABC subunit C [Candidatus Adiutrix sp.]
YRKDGLIEGALLLIRSGVVSGCVPLESTGGGETEFSEAAASFLSQYYSAGHFVPDEVLLPESGLDDGETLEQWLSSLKGRAVKLVVPQKGDRLKIVSMAGENARAALEERLGRLGRTSGALVELKSRLNLEKMPHRLECFDLAHMQGRDAAAGLVVMEDGEWKKSQYRRFRIKQAKGGDDYGGMREVVARRFGHEDWAWPDLLLIDGGRGQLAFALAAFEELGLKPPPVAAIAKIRQEGEIDRVFLPGRKNPADLKAGSPALLLLSRLRDEAHRYVGVYHHQLQAKSFLSSPLLTVPGLGEAKRRKLLNHFGSLESLIVAADDDVLKVIALSPEGLIKLREVLKIWEKSADATAAAE